MTRSIGMETRGLSRFRQESAPVGVANNHDEYLIGCFCAY
jgi:hypothetical protein